MRGISTGDLGRPVQPGRLHDAPRAGGRSGCLLAWSTRPSTTPSPGANVVTTENSDWATNCPEYKVTAVQVGVANARSNEAVAETRTPAETHA